VARTKQSEILEEIEDDVASLHEADSAAHILELRLANPADIREVWIIRRALKRVKQRADARRARASAKRSVQDSPPGNSLADGDLGVAALNCTTADSTT